MKKYKINIPKPNWNGETNWEQLYNRLDFICCDCGLAHTFKIRNNKGKLEWRAKRNKELTKSYRKNVRKIIKNV